MEFKDKLKQLRIQNGLTQKELAEKLICTRSAVAKWENGLGMPNEDSFNRLCETFNVEKNDLFGDELNEKSHIRKNNIIIRQKNLLIIISSLLIILLISFLITLIKSVNNYVNKKEFIESTLIDIPDIKLNDMKSNNKFKYDLYRKEGKINLDYLSYDPKLNNEIDYDSITTIEKSSKYSLDIETNNEIKINYYYADYLYDNKYTFHRINEEINNNSEISLYADNSSMFESIITKNKEFSIPNNEYFNFIEIIATIDNHKFVYLYLAK